MSDDNKLPAYESLIAQARRLYEREGVRISDDALVFPCARHAIVKVQAWLTVPYNTGSK